MPQILPITRFGNPILRENTKQLTRREIVSEKIQTLINNMRHTLVEREYGVGIAAPQVGESIALSVIGVKPTPNRPELTPFETVLINPRIVKTIGEKTSAWEGCVSCGSGDDVLFALTPRYEKVEITWTDEAGNDRKQLFEGFVAQVIQHEIDHLNGVLFVDHVVDPRSYMMADEYRKRVVKR